MSDRLDDRLARALEEGAIPADASPAESEEIAQALAAMETLGAARLQAQAEAAEALPGARQRFETFMAGRQQSLPAEYPRPWHSGIAGLFRWSPRFRMYAAATAALALVVAAALLVPVLFGRVETARAEVLVPGEYVQFEAVAGESSGEVLAAAAEFGDVDVIVDAETQLLDTEGQPGALSPGRRIVVAGVVGEDLRVRARTVSIAGADAEQPRRRPVQRLRDLREAISGTVVAVSYSEAGEPRVAVAVGRERLVVVAVAGDAFRAFLETVREPIGAAVRVISLGGDEGPFGLEATASGAETPVPGQEHPRLLTFAGTVTARDGLTLTVATLLRGEVRVRLTADTQFRIGDPSVLREELRGERLIGRLVTVHAVPDPRAPGVLVADTILVGREAERQAR
jgi:hypothetical protein